MIRRLFQVLPVLAAIFTVFTCVQATRGQDASQANTAPATAATLKIGDPAPKIQVDHWLGGQPVESFAKGKVYVVEFWATWCGPCLKAMPHLSELAEQHAKEGLIVIAMTKADEGNTREAVEEFIKGPGAKYAFRFAFCEGETTYRNYMDAAEQKGIPCSFVIDREGNVAYIGHPHDLDYVLQRVVKGQWRGQADADELRSVNESIAKLGELAQKDPDKALEITKHVRRVNPKRTKSLDFAYAEVMVFCQKKMHDEAKASIESFLDGSNKTIEWGAVAMLSGVLASNEMNPEGKHREYAMTKIQAAEDALKDDWSNLVQVGVAYQLSGDKDKFKACMEKVIKLCPDEQMKKALQLAIEVQAKSP